MTNNELYKKLLKKIILFISLLLPITQLSASHFVLNDTLRTNLDINADTIFVTKDILIPQNTILIINPGTLVLFNGYYYFDVKGQILALGKRTKPITFTTKDTTNGWLGIRFFNNIYPDTSRFNNCIFKYAKAKNTLDMHFSNGDAIYTYQFSKLKIDSCFFTKNYKCAIFLKGYTGKIKNCSFSGNKGIGLNGDDSEIEFSKCQFNNNYRRGLVAYNSTKIFECSFINNLQGGISLGDCNSHIENCIIDNNYSGGININSGGNATLINNIISNNSSNTEGGGIYTDSQVKSVILKNNLIFNNYSNSNGGGIYNNGNKIYSYNNTIINNTAKGNGGGIYNVNITSGDIKNCIFRGNKATNGNQIAKGSGANYTNFYNCNIQGDSSGFYGGFNGIYQNNIDKDPLFADTTSVFRLKANSPCINKGSDTTGLKLPATDLAGLARIAYDTIDIGAFEYHAPTGIPNRIKAITDITVKEDFSTFSFDLDTVFSYNLGCKFLAYTVNSGSDTSRLSAKVSFNKLNIKSKANIYGKDTLYLKATDGLGGFAFDTFMITIDSVNDIPVITNSSIIISENQRKNTLIYTIPCTHPDTKQYLKYKILSGNNGEIRLDSLNGIISVADSSKINYEVLKKITLTIEVRDNYFTPAKDTATITLNISNINERPYFTNLPDTITIYENPRYLQVLDTILAIDEDPGGIRWFGIITGNTNSAIKEEGSKYEIYKVWDSTQFDYEKDSLMCFLVVATDLSTYYLEDSAYFCVKIIDIDETGIGDIVAEKQELNIYPIPAKNIINIDIPNDYLNSTLKINDPNGKQILSTIAKSSKVSIDISKYNSGVYFILLENKNKILRGRWLKE